MKDTFTTGEVAKITRVNANTIKVWRRRGQVDIGDQKGWGRYNFDDVFRIALIGRLLRLGQPIARAAYIAHADKFSGRVMYEEPEQTFLIIGADQSIDADDEIGMPRFEIVSGGTSVSHPQIPLLQEDEKGEPRAFGWALGSTDFIAVNLTALEAQIMLKIRMMKVGAEMKANPEGFEQ